MEARSFHLRSVAKHAGDDNQLLALGIELELDGAWQAVELECKSPPFRAFLCAALMCQHAYLRMNAAERSVLLDSVRGELWVETEDWLVASLKAHFDLELRAGVPAPGDLDFIAERMRDCPISRNLPRALKQTTLATGQR